MLRHNLRATPQAYTLDMDDTKEPLMEKKTLVLTLYLAKKLIQ